MNGISEQEKAVLIDCAWRMEAIRTVKRPRAWQTWAVRELEELKRYGPRYMPSLWFNGGRAIPERVRVKFLRAVHRLEEAGLLETAGVGVRLQNLKLTPELMAGPEEVADE